MALVTHSPNMVLKGTLGIVLSLVSRDGYFSRASQYSFTVHNVSQSLTESANVRNILHPLRSFCQEQKDSLNAPLDPQSGFAPRLRQLCEQQYVSYSLRDSKSSLIRFPGCITFERRGTRRQRRLTH
jgi:hypothetical protein